MYCLEYFNIIPLHLESKFCSPLECSCVGGGITDTMGVNLGRLRETAEDRGLECCSLWDREAPDTTGRPNSKQLLHSATLDFTVQQRESAICLHISPFFGFLSHLCHHRSLSSLCYPVSSN